MAGLRKIFMENRKKECFRNEWKYLISTSEKELLKLRMKHFLKRHAGACFLAAFAAAGLAFGLGYYFAVGCALGACPITSNPAASALYGGVMGFLLGYILLPQRWTGRKKADGAEK